MQIVPYLAGGLTVFLMMDLVPIPSLSEQLGAVRAAVSEPAPLLGTPASSVNRAAKADRGAPPRSGDAASQIVHQHSSSAVKPVPIYEINERAGDNNIKRPAPRAPKVPFGCEPSFSPVAAPSLAHHTGRCMAGIHTVARAS